MSSEDSAKPGCRFCQFGTVNDATPIILATPKFLAVFNHKALTEGHSMLIPRSHRERLSELDTFELAELGGALVTLTKKLAAFSGDFTVSLNHGEVAGQHVPHIHFHVIPRYASGRGSLASGVAWGYDQRPLNVGLAEMQRLLQNVGGTTVVSGTE